MGDNSEDQCAILGRRANVPEKILKEFRVSEIFAGETHNVALSEDNKLYSWGGSTINKSWIKQKSNESKLRLMEDLNLRKISLIDLSYSNTIVITGQ
jgi:alpha-tubulin suppressor-like RCC1 family protein